MKRVKGEPLKVLLRMYVALCVCRRNNIINVYTISLSIIQRYTLWHDADWMEYAPNTLIMMMMMMTMMVVRECLLEVFRDLSRLPRPLIEHKAASQCIEPISCIIASLNRWHGIQ